ncbi:MAG: DnaJ C-terminal domain-containing protein [Lacipirellulaceae bacterium]
MANDYYATLGVTREATDEEIRKAYRDLARKHHPDLNPDNPKAKQKFQEVQVAFEVLNDPKKREQYDRFGSAFDPSRGAGAWPPGGQTWGSGPAGASGEGAAFEFDLGDLFGGASRPSGGGGAFADLFKQFGGGARPRPAPATRGGDIVHEISVSFATAVAGGEVALTVERGSGKPEEIQVKVPAGIEDGRKIRLRGQGNPGARGAVAGDILLTVRVAPHPWFRRRGERLEVTVPVTIAEAMRGAKIDLPTPKGTITLTIPAGATSGQTLRVRGHGVQWQGKPPGDLFAEVQVALPADPSADDREALAAISDRYPQSPRAKLAW